MSPMNPGIVILASGNPAIREEQPTDKNNIQMVIPVVTDLIFGHIMLLDLNLLKCCKHTS